ncbi:MAG TPA: DUF2934 domain-containing protein [Bryobacteraceae bacterium]|nr:DUF2934 domain-containing protein [Bryobacteraceae bacterium]
MDDVLRAIAHALWEAEGRPEGQDMRFWLQAEEIYNGDHLTFRRRAQD